MYRRSNTFAALFENAEMGKNKCFILDHYIYPKMCFYLFLEKLKYYINWYIILIKEYEANRVKITVGIWRRTLIRIFFLLGVLLHSPFFWLDPLWGPKRRKTMKYGVASNKASIEAMASTAAVVSKNWPVSSFLLANLKFLQTLVTRLFVNLCFCQTYLAFHNC